MLDNRGIASNPSFVRHAERRNVQVSHRYICSYPIIAMLSNETKRSHIGPNLSKSLGYFLEKRNVHESQDPPNSVAFFTIKP